jgi:hypothetical protein
MKIHKETASLVNALIANNGHHVPTVGEDVTQCFWTDREAWRVIAVDPDGKGATLARYTPKAVGSYYAQEYIYDDENGNPMLNYKHTIHIRYKYKAWRCGGVKVHLAWNTRREYEDPTF